MCKIYKNTVVRPWTNNGLCVSWIQFIKSQPLFVGEKPLSAQGGLKSKLCNIMIDPTFGNYGYVHFCQTSTR